jgi:hypothetical protein
MSGIFLADGTPMIREGGENGREDAQENQALAAPRKEVPFKTRVSGHNAGSRCSF